MMITLNASMTTVRSPTGKMHSLSFNEMRSCTKGVVMENMISIITRNFAKLTSAMNEFALMKEYFYNNDVSEFVAFDDIDIEDLLKKYYRNDKIKCSLVSLMIGKKMEMEPHR
ncbi:hypothetical protein VNO78_08784 [Psophocarpus tetragonolobus]|uniref:Uncharacterized protein n=1 Tax=Psophocarpus tetragonolobus TaxID=3891 RepID=A0AAN9SYL7_PSOTE